MRIFAPQLSLMKLRILFLFSLLLTSRIFAQDTLTVMHYNLLYYGEVTGFCNNSNNSLSMKDPHLRTILNYVKPDIFTVNEISSNTGVHQHLLDQNLNIGGVGHFRKAGFNPVAGSNIVNMLYYDSRKLRLKKQSVAQSYVRDVDVYELYYYSNDLPQGDTAFIICVVGHLKAGNSSSDAGARKVMAENTMKYLEQRYKHENVLFMGDFNLYSGNEAAFQQMINYSNADTRLIDPIGQIGDWNNNSFYASVHTQSTNTSSNDCKSGGGLDDRFDFILISDEVRFGTKKVRYVQQSYESVGQDGNRFNSTVVSPANSSVPPNVATALFNMSDHLPVALKLRVDKVLSTGNITTTPFLASLAPNPAGEMAQLMFYSSREQAMQICLFNSSGIMLRELDMIAQTGRQTIDLSLNGLSGGFYVVRLTDSEGNREQIKLVKSL
jgi:endonuclease/exonuclease/phosphatase family metal-dependent hydrolase